MSLITERNLIKEDRNKPTLQVQRKEVVLNDTVSLGLDINR